MSTKEQVFAEIAISDKVMVSKEDNTIVIKGKLGTLKKDFSMLPASVIVQNKIIIIKPYGTRKKDRAITNTARSIINSMIYGVEKGFTYKLKIIYAHFPIAVRTKGQEVYVENFFGERSPRISRIVGDSTRVNVVGEDVIVQGPSLEDVSQTAANIESSTKLKEKDQRVFLDGLYIYSREKGMPLR